MPFGNVSVCAVADWEISTLKKLGLLASKDPVVLVERLFDSGFGRVVEEQRLCVREQRGGHFSHLRNTQGKGADVFVMDGKLAIFPWKGGTAQELRSVVASPLTSVDWTFLHNWNHGRGILISEFAHNLLLGVVEDYVHRMKGIMSLFLKIVWDIKRTRQWIKDSP